MTPTLNETPAPITAPVQFPVVTIGGRALVVKADFYAQYLLSKGKHSIGDAMRMVLAKDPEMVAGLVDLWAACVAENFKKRGEPIPTADDWALAINADPAGYQEKWKECCSAMNLSIKKVFRVQVTPGTPTESEVANPQS